MNNGPKNGHAVEVDSSHLARDLRERACDLTAYLLARREYSYAAAVVVLLEGIDRAAEAMSAAQSAPPPSRTPPAPAAARDTHRHSYDDAGKCTFPDCGRSYKPRAPKQTTPPGAGS
jgi:hypothetical protein